MSRAGRGNAVGMAGLRRRRSTVNERVRTISDVVSTIAIVAAAVAIIVKIWVPVGARAQRPSIPVPAKPVTVSRSPTLGASQSRAVVVEFTDFECPYCARFVRDIFPTLKSEYIDKNLIRFVFKHNPLKALHSHAERAALSAQCAAQQGRFWPMQDELFRVPSDLGESGLGQHAIDAGLDPSRFRQCMTLGDGSAVQADAELASALSLTSTPTFLIGRPVGMDSVQVDSVVAGVRPVADFRAAIDKVLSAQ